MKNKTVNTIVKFYDEKLKIGAIAACYDDGHFKLTYLEDKECIEVVLNYLKISFPNLILIEVENVEMFKKVHRDVVNKILDDMFVNS